MVSVLVILLELMQWILLILIFSNLGKLWKSYTVVRLAVWGREKAHPETWDPPV